VILSASCTAVRDVEEPDEFLSLASALLVVRCPNVVGTLRSVRDSDASEFSAYFYRSLIRSGRPISHELVAQATSVAVRNLRQKYPETPSAWCGFVLQCLKRRVC
jgi:CHAT domain-containing protein